MMTFYGLRQGQKPTSLGRVLGGFGRPPQSDSVEIGSQRNGNAHADSRPAAAVQNSADSHTLTSHTPRTLA